MNVLKIDRQIKSNIERNFYSLGTLNHIQIFDRFDEKLLDWAMERVFQIENMLSVFQNDSDIAKLNQNAGRGFVPVQAETFELLRKSLEFSELSGGAFDVTIRPLIDLWGIGKKESHIPEEEELFRTKKLVDYRKLILDEKSQSAALIYEGQAIDLGGIAKGYAAEEVKRVLVENNVKSALINLGGNILAVGTQTNGKPWKIGIQNPMAPTGQYFGTLDVTDKTVVTSGSNERFFIKNGIRYHHILDPRTGVPARSGILSVTAVCENSTDADAITTSIFVSGPEQGMELAKKMKVEVIFVTEKLDVIVSEGLRNQFNLLNNEK